MATGPGGSVLGADPALRAGDKVTITAGGFGAHEKVKVTLHSAPKSLGTVSAGAGGKATYHLTVPSGLTGAHRVVLAGAAVSRTFAFHLAAAPASTSNGGFVAAASTDPLAHTGANVGSTVGLAMVLLFLGIGALMTTRRLTPRVVPRGRHR